jgi:hypothetical protein
MRSNAVVHLARSGEIDIEHHQNQSSVEASTPLAGLASLARGLLHFPFGLIPAEYRLDHATHGLEIERTSGIDVRGTCFAYVNLHNTQTITVARPTTC